MAFKHKINTGVDVAGERGNRRAHLSAEVTEVPNQRSMVCLSSRSPAKPSARMARTTVASEVWVAVAISIAVCSSTTSRLSLI